jgi:chorismate mutase
VELDKSGASAMKTENPLRKDIDVSGLLKILLKLTRNFTCIPESITSVKDAITSDIKAANFPK